MGNISVASDQGEVIVFAPSRIVIGEGARTLREVVQSLTAGGFPKIVLDMALTSYVDSAGMAELVAGFTLADRKGGRLKLNRVQKGPRRLLDVTKLDSVFDIDERNLDTLPRIDVESTDVSSVRAAQTLPLLLSLRENHIYVEFGAEDGVLKIRADGHDTSQGSLIVATPHILSAGTRTILHQQLREFEELINSSSTRENDIHRFLETNPNFLLGESYSQLHSKVLLEREGDVR